jgi:hypothetical protein
MKIRLAIILTTIALLFAVGLLWPAPGNCYWCTPTFCGFDHDCPENCACCITEGEITGECC